MGFLGARNLKKVARRQCMRKAWTVAGTLWVFVSLLSSASQRAPAPTDKVITEEIQAKLYQDQVLKTRDICVITQGGIVILTGQEQSAGEKAAAEEIASQTNGVTKVVNELAVVGASGASSTPRPPWMPAGNTSLPAALVMKGPCHLLWRHAATSVAMAFQVRKQ